MLRVLPVCMWHNIRCFTEIKVDWIFIILTLSFNLTLISVKYRSYCFLLVGSRRSLNSSSLLLVVPSHFFVWLSILRHIFCHLGIYAWRHGLDVPPHLCKMFHIYFVPLCLRNISPPSLCQMTSLSSLSNFS